MSIIDELTSALGPAKVALDAPTLAAYAVDQAPVLDYQLPQAVVRAESVDDVQATVRACAAARGSAGGPRRRHRRLGRRAREQGLRRAEPGTDEPHPGPQPG